MHRLGRNPRTADGRLVALLGRRPVALLVRPDGYVLAKTTGDRPGPLLRALTTIRR